MGTYYLCSISSELGGKNKANDVKTGESTRSHPLVMGGTEAAYTAIYCTVVEFLSRTETRWCLNTVLCTYECETPQ